MTDVIIAKPTFNGITTEGVVVGDKVGEVKYISIDKLISEGIKQAPV